MLADSMAAVWVLVPPSRPQQVFQSSDRSLGNILLPKLGEADET